METHDFRGRRALSAQGRVWQSAAAASLLLALAAPLAAVPGGDVGTLEIGRYACEVPNPQDVARGSPVAGAGFSVVNASNYRSDGVMGSYLRIGDGVTFTSGPRDGEHWRMMSKGTLLRLDTAGADTSLRCVLVKRNAR